MYVDPGAVISAAQLIADNRKTIFSSLRRIIHFLKHGKQTILIFGAGGVGKSTLAAYMSNHEHLLDQNIPPKETLDVETFHVSGTLFGTILVPPGQTRRIPHHWPGLTKELSAGRVTGVIYVGCWGLHTMRD